MSNKNVQLRKISVGASVGKAKPGSVNIYLDADGVLKQVDENDAHSEVAGVAVEDVRNQTILQTVIMASKIQNLEELLIVESLNAIALKQERIIDLLEELLIVESLNAVSFKQERIINLLEALTAKLDADSADTGGDSDYTDLTNNLN